MQNGSVNIGEEDPDVITATLREDALQRVLDELGNIGEKYTDIIAAARIQVYDELKSIEGGQAQ